MKVLTTSNSSISENHKPTDSIAEKLRNLVTNLIKKDQKRARFGEPHFEHQFTTVTDQDLQMIHKNMKLYFMQSQEKDLKRKYYYNV
jgi:hypothetical protein